MRIDEKFMYRCLQLARKGEGFVRPNPMVGAVVVHDGKIIGEGYHAQYGGAHAEVNAIGSVRDPRLLSSSTLYVSLEPCAHHGKTPPCASLIIEKSIPQVVVAVSDPNPRVAGRGIEMMREAGIEVALGLLQEEASELNRLFFVNHLFKRPYVVLKWAQSADGFIDHHRSPGARQTAAQISNSLTQTIVHKFRTQVQGIMVGTNTALLDNPQLTARKWFGNNPARIVIDKEAKIPPTSALFNSDAEVFVFTQSDYPVKKSNLRAMVIDFEGDTNSQILKHLYDAGICSVLVEGGAQLLDSFIAKGCWDETFVEISDSKQLSAGVEAPRLGMAGAAIRRYSDSLQLHLKNKTTQNFL